MGALPSVSDVLPVATTPPTDAALLNQVRGIIKGDALKPSGDESITAGAIDGMLASLDDTYAAYFDPKAFKEFQSDSMGEFFGIGVTIGLSKDAQPQVNSVFQGTPAAKAGLKAGDVFASIDGVTKPKWDLEDVVNRVRGPIGTKVALMVKRNGGSPFKVVVTRDKILVPNVTKKTYGQVGYVALMSFNEHSADDLRAAIQEFDKKRVKGYVLDLRGNPGGLLRSAVDVSSIFIADGVIVRIDERGKPEAEERATGTAITKKPLVVLVDSHSASASEIVAGALQDYGRAVIVGDQSFGKGSVQTIRNLDNGGGLKLTTAHYLTPKKQVINGHGVTPDVLVKMELKLRGDAKKDTQLLRALEVLRAKF
jgi:carboxyl-terminal processing protease